MNLTITMRERVEYYLRHKRNMGFQLRIEGEQLLRFAEYADKKGNNIPLSADLAIEWIRSSKKKSRLTWARRLEIIRTFTKYYQIIDPSTEVPSNHLFGPAHKRIMPHIFSEQEINDLLTAITQILSFSGLRGITFSYLFGLLVTTGMRVSEALSLKDDDIDLSKRIITIRDTKFKKSRHVVIHSTTSHALKKYLTLRNQHIPDPTNSNFFIGKDGKRLNVRQADYAFGCLRKHLGWSKKPRIYDLRHTFICNRLLTWYQEGKNVQQLIVFLSTYVGHVKVTDTYWYITGIPELMKITSKRFELYTQNITGELQ